MPVLFQEAEDIRAPVVHVSVDQEIVVRPYHGDVVVNADEWIVEALLRRAVPPVISLGRSRNGVHDI